MYVAVVQCRNAGIRESVVLLVGRGLGMDYGMIQCWHRLVKEGLDEVQLVQGVVQKLNRIREGLVKRQI